MKKPYKKISYDKESKILSFLVKSAKSADSDISGNLVIDYDKKGDVVRVDFYDFDFNDFKEIKKNIKGFMPRMFAFQ